MLMAQKRKKPKRHSKAKAASPWIAKLKRLREQLGEKQGRQRITQAEAAKLCRVPTRTWISWETGQYQPGRMALERLRDTFPQLFSTT